MTFNNRLIKIGLIIIILATGVVAFIYYKITNYKIPSKMLTYNEVPYVEAKEQPTLSKIKHVFIIVEENHDWAQIKGNSQAKFINEKLLTEGAYASKYHNLPKSIGALHPSKPNYILLEAGKIAFQDHTFTNNDPPSETNSTASNEHLVKLLDDNGITWKSYQEDIDGTTCPINNDKKYRTKHNPFVYFHSVTGNPPSESNSYCIEHIRPFSELQDDLQKGSVPNYIFITPNMDNDMHDGSIAQADMWLSNVVTMIINSDVFKQDGVLFITWDEGDDFFKDNNPIGMIILSPFIKPGYTNNIEYSHFSYLKTVQEIFNVYPLLGGAANPDTKDLNEFFQN